MNCKSLIGFIPSIVVAFFGANVLTSVIVGLGLNTWLGHYGWYGHWVRPILNSLIRLVLVFGFGALLHFGFKRYAMWPEPAEKMAH